MITDADVAKLKKSFVTKGEFAPVKKDVGVLKADVKVLKADVKVLKADVKVLKADVSILKVDVKELKADVSELKFDFAIMQQTIIRLEDKVDASAENSKNMFNKILTVVESFAGNISDLEQENKMGARTMHRHGIQIYELADATGTTISG